MSNVQFRIYIYDFQKFESVNMNKRKAPAGFGFMLCIQFTELGRDCKHDCPRLNYYKYIEHDRPRLNYFEYIEHDLGVPCGFP